MIRYIFFLAVLFVMVDGYSAKWDLYSIVDTIPIKKVNTSNVYDELVDWFEKYRNIKIVRSNKELLTIEGKGYFVYYNHIMVEDIFLSPRANERTTGSVTYSISLTVKDSIVLAQFSNFIHEAYYSQYGKMSFGLMTKYELPPPGVCLENKKWCGMVWADMKEKAEADIKEIISDILPDAMIRKKGKVYKVEEKELAVDTVKKQQFDYLDINNYIKKE